MVVVQGSLARTKKSLSDFTFGLPYPQRRLFLAAYQQAMRSM